MKINKEIKKPDKSGVKTIREGIDVIFEEPLLIEKKRMKWEDFGYDCSVEEMNKAFENGKGKENNRFYNKCLNVMKKTIFLYNAVQQENITLDDYVSGEDCWGIVSNFGLISKYRDYFDFR